MKGTLDSVDRSLIARIAKNGERDAFERLYHAYRKRLGPFMFRIVKDFGSNEEAFNDVMLAVWRNAGTYDGTSKVSTWIFSIAYRHCLKTLKRRTDTVPLDVTEPQAIDARPHDEQQDLIRHALRRLSPEHRLVIELSYFEGRDYQEIAAIAQCPENTVKTRVFYARRKLREILTELGERSLTE